MKILVTGAGSRIGQAIIKLINKSKYKSKIIAADYFEDSIGFFWSHKNYILPDFLKKNISNKDWVRKIEMIISENNIKLILPGVDFELKLFAKYKNYLERKYNLVCAVSNLNIINIFNDKLKTHNFLSKNNIKCSLTYPFMNKSKFFDTIKKGKFVIKPRVGHTSKDVIFLNNQKELNNISNYNKMLIIQEFLKGEEYTCGTIIKNKSIHSIIILKRILENGNTKLATRVDDNEIVKYINKIVLASDFFGAINFQLIKTTKGPVLLEVNPRFSGTSYTRYLFGINEFDILFELINNKKISQKKLKNGTVIKYIEDYFINSSMYNVK